MGLGGGSEALRLLVLIGVGVRGASARGAALSQLPCSLGLPSGFSAGWLGPSVTGTNGTISSMCSKWATARPLFIQEASV